MLLPAMVDLYYYLAFFIIQTCYISSRHSCLFIVFRCSVFGVLISWPFRKHSSKIFSPSHVMN